MHIIALQIIKKLDNVSILNRSYLKDHGGISNIDFNERKDNKLYQ